MIPEYKFISIKVKLSLNLKYSMVLLRHVHSGGNFPTGTSGSSKTPPPQPFSLIRRNYSSLIRKEFLPLIIRKKSFLRKIKLKIFLWTLFIRSLFQDQKRNNMLLTTIILILCILNFLYPIIITIEVYIRTLLLFGSQLIAYDKFGGLFSKILLQNNLDLQEIIQLRLKSNEYFFFGFSLFNLTVNKTVMTGTGKAALGAALLGAGALLTNGYLDRQAADRRQEEHHAHERSERMARETHERNERMARETHERNERMAKEAYENKQKKWFNWTK